MNSVVLAVLSLMAGIMPFLMIRTEESTTNVGGNRDLLLVVNKGDHTLSVVDPEAGEQISVVQVGGITGHEVAAAPNGRTAWVPIYGDSGVGQAGSDGRTISVIDLTSFAKVDSIDLQRPSRPHCAVFDAKGERLYVTSEVTKSLEVIDPATRKVIDSIPTGQPESHMVALSSDGKRAYTSNVGAGTVSAIDLHQKKVTAVISVSRTIQRIAISPDDRWVFTADQTKPRIAVIDTVNNAVKSWVELSDIGFGMAATRDGRRLLATNPGSQSVSIIDLRSMKVEQVIHVPPDPQEILIRPDDHFAYVSCDRSKQVAAINLTSAKVEKIIKVGAGADGLAWAAAARR